MKFCSKCNLLRDSDSFYKNAVRCKECDDTRAKTWKRQNPEASANHYRNSRMLRVYGISLNQYNWLLASQGGVCKICYKTPEENGKMLAVDHEHTTKEVRGILCDACNKAIGCFQDSTWVLRSAIDYLEKSVSLWH